MIKIIRITIYIQIGGDSHRYYMIHDNQLYITVRDGKWPGHLLKWPKMTSEWLVIMVIYILGHLKMTRDQMTQVIWKWPGSFGERSESFAIGGSFKVCAWSDAVPRDPTRPDTKVRTGQILIDPSHDPGQRVISAYKF